MPKTTPTTELYLVIIETSSNQDYIFSTNKLRENIGASELTYRSGTQWVLEAIAAPAEQRGFEVWTDSTRLRQILLDPAKNPPIEESDQAVEILTAASGKALFLTKTQEVAQSIIREVTRRALVEAPGLTIAGVYEKVGTLGKHGALAEAIQKVHRKLETERSHFPSPENRFLRLPIVAECTSSGLPASARVPEGGRHRAISQVNHAKWLFAPKAKERLAKLDPRLTRQIDQLVDEGQKGDQGSAASSGDRLLKDDATSDPRSWLGIVHADGNGLGQIFLNFERYLGDDTSDRNYINTYRKFSLALDKCTEAAFIRALDEVFPADKKDGAVPVVPLILGGDDLTVVCDGHYALEFTRAFLQAFEQQTKAHESIAPIAKAAFGVDRLSACAGVAIVKRHFPFSVAYSLAAELIRSAKQVKQQITCPPTDKISKDTPFPCSALDFHILYDTTGIDLEAIQAKLTPEAQTRLYNRPYIVSDLEHLQQAEGYAWATLHDWETLNQRVQWLKQGKALGDRKEQTTSETTEQKHPPPLSSSQYHLLREALFRGKDAADAQYGLIRQRYDLAKFAESEARDSLFHATTDDSGEVFVTSFLDALEAMDFLKNDKTDPVQQPEGVNS
ncbi:hypothetical protein [Nodosilinea sp. P-1105]|uniref:Cas10/Cmr2 second palm domain-containing protein n=1 Tax=Nodosilinea sp. P-1105 TaxID=2546229 RepID=UPI00146C702F|nr:hypothetical protein [Nodosilinea sp. P-1105]NMF84119.1 hypothetical protein [Nodosilinea sp. P-1105]